MTQLPMIYLLTVLTILHQANTKFQFFINEVRPTSYYKCMNPNTDGKITHLLTYDEDEIDKSHLEGIQNAVEAGMEVELVIVPYRCRMVEQDIQFIRGRVEVKDIRRFWVSLGSYDSQKCDWSSYSPEENCLYLQEYVNKWKALGVQIDVLLCEGDWQKAFNASDACPEPSATSVLWWFEKIKYKHLGGWKTPYMKYLTEAELCGYLAYVSQTLHQQQS